MQKNVQRKKEQKKKKKQRKQKQNRSRGRRRKKLLPFVVHSHLKKKGTRTNTEWNSFIFHETSAVNSNGPALIGTD